jgi:hypothetical protein
MSAHCSTSTWPGGLLDAPLDLERVGAGVPLPLEVPGAVAAGVDVLRVVPGELSLVEPTGVREMKPATKVRISSRPGVPPSLPRLSCACDH